MVRARQDAAEELDQVKHFILNGSEEVEIKHKKGEETPIGSFEKAYKNYQKSRHEYANPLKRDEYSTIESCGYEVKTVYKCKECDKDFNKVNCGSHYHKGNKRRRVIIMNMCIVDAIFEEETEEKLHARKERIGKYSTAPNCSVCNIEPAVAAGYCEGCKNFI